MHNLSFDFGDRYFEFGGYQIAFRVYTLTNVYGLDPARATATAIEGSTLTVRSGGYIAAGGQLTCPGEFEAHLRSLEGGLGVGVVAWATHAEPIKAVGVLVRGAPDLAALVDQHGPPANGDDGEIEDLIPSRWPDGAELRYPRHGYPVFFGHPEAGGSLFYALSMDDEVREKRLAVWFDKRREQVIDLISVEHARRFGRSITMPEWRFGRCADPMEIYRQRFGLMEERWGLRRWEERVDVPAWFYQVSLVLNLHGEHWTGYIFNTFEQQLDVLRYVTQHISGERVLAYLPAWDGRYYYDYPLYRVSERMGGEAGLRRLVDGAHQLGVHVVPMFGANGANLKWLRHLGLEDAIAHSSQGWEDAVNFVDWDVDRSGEEQVHWANLGHPGFQEHMFGRACDLLDRLTTTNQRSLP